MTEPTKYSSISGPGRNFASKAKELLNKVPEEGTLLQMQYFRDHALGLFSDHEVENLIAGEFKKIYPDSDHSPEPPNSSLQTSSVAKGIELEIRGFCLAYEAGKMRLPNTLENKAFTNRCISRMATVSGSFKDIFEGLPAYAKGTLTLFGELCGLFKRD